MDGTSHSIYIYGGINQESNPSNALDALDGVWALTMPYFNWVNVGRAPVARESMFCDLISENTWYPTAAGQGRATATFGLVGQKHKASIYLTLPHWPGQRNTSNQWELQATRYQ